MGDGCVGDHFHRFLRGFTRFCAPIAEKKLPVAAMFVNGSGQNEQSL
jgi:hypothetical protein